jgi:UDP-N-acetylglucosamine--N-acetylmuramyl-(pentapeptide) pyrophosphoryl-undecaprenol N-acetylglucosamine transferase
MLVNTKNNMSKILFSGGGTLGSVSPLLAIKENLENKNFEFCWVGTENGPEQKIIEDKSISFYSIKTAKFRRYFSWQNFLAPVRFVFAFFQALKILLKEGPDLCITAGGFVSVPVHFAAYLKGVPTWVHQQDIKVGLANNLMVKMATKVTVALEESREEFSRDDIDCIGNPVREEIYQGNREEARNIFNISSDKPVLFALGGGTGAREINQLITNSLDELEDFEIIHVTGPERDGSKARRLAKQYSNYHVTEFLEENIKHAYAVADVVLCRAGFSTLTELSALQIPAVLVPKEGHQEDNAEIFSQSNQFINFKESNLKLTKAIEQLRRNEQIENKTLQITSRIKIQNIVNNLLKFN